MIIGITIAGPTLAKRTSGSPNVALSAAMVRSHSITSSQPPPITCPWTEAITGFFIVHGSISNSSCGCRCSCARVGSLRQSSFPGSLAEMSYPAQKLRPSARSSTTLVAASASARANAFVSCCCNSALMALSFSGRLSVMMLTFSSTSYKTTGSATVRAPLSAVMARQPVDGEKSLSDAADDRNAYRPEKSDLLSIHDARASVKQKMRILAARGHTSEELEIAPRNLGHLEGLTIAVVAT